ncbi:hypothetical protein G3576_17830 [Roseomonas stagni]|uniref:Uncharacterized protein n=1 Tax=Falsiroseomonas algicola TaxID=2716930 RepID=A0A6M1LPF6_9PROT|nr:hypothetical protein [Falsiroseomonas algicola]NGM21889.1 hypothetical protein [Falsiroseomonas algicola]
MAADGILDAIRRGEARLGPALDPLVRQVEEQLRPAERHGLARMLETWPGARAGRPQRPEALEEGLAVLLAQAQGARRSDVFDSLKPAAKAGSFGLLCGIVAAMAVDVVAYGSAWSGPQVLHWVLSGTPALLLGAFGYRQARQPTRRSRTLFHGLVALPIGGFGSTILLLAILVGLDDGQGRSALDSVDPAWLVLGLVVVTLLGGVATAAWAMRRAWRRWDEAP